MTQHTNFPPNIDRQTCGSMPRARTLETHAERGHDTTSISSIGPASTASADTLRPASAASEQQIRARSQIQENDADNCRIGGCGKLFHMSVQPSRLYGNGTHCHRKTATGEKQVLTQHTNFSPNIDRQTCCSTPRARMLEKHAQRGHDTTSISSISRHAQTTWPRSEVRQAQTTILRNAKFQLASH